MPLEQILTTADAAILKFGELYRTSKAGDIPWKQFPEVLQSTEVAKIPSVVVDVNQAEQRANE